MYKLMAYCPRNKSAILFGAAASFLVPADHTGQLCRTARACVCVCVCVRTSHILSG
jgi:hypothetical protein